MTIVVVADMLGTQLLDGDPEPAPCVVSAPAQPHPRNNVSIGDDPRNLPDFAVFKDVDAPWCPEMVVIPSGTFLMGALSNEKGRVDVEPRPSAGDAGWLVE